MNRSSRTYEEISNKYTKALSKGFSFPNPFGPKNKYNLDRNELFEQYQYETKKLIKSLEHWNESQLDTYVLPHPLLGKLSIREMLYFTILHTNHHFNSIKNISKK